MTYTGCSCGVPGCIGLCSMAQNQGLQNQMGQSQMGLGIGLQGLGQGYGNSSWLAVAHSPSLPPPETAHERMARIKAECEEVRIAYERFSKEDGLEPGDIVTQIEALQFYDFPKPGSPAVVVESFDRRCIAQGIGKPILHESAVIGVYVDDKFLLFPVDGRRFEKIR